jgi:hypothetical protein
MCEDYPQLEPKEGVAGVLAGKKMCLIPEGTMREARRKAYRKDKKHSGRCNE